MQGNIKYNKQLFIMQMNCSIDYSLLRKKSLLQTKAKKEKENTTLIK